MINTYMPSEKSSESISAKELIDENSQHLKESPFRGIEVKS